MGQLDLFGDGNVLASSPRVNVASGLLKPDDRVFTVKQVAAIIGYHPMTVYHWVDDLGLPVRQATRKGRIAIVWREFLQWWERLKRNDFRPK